MVREYDDWMGLNFEARSPCANVLFKATFQLKAIAERSGCYTFKDIP